MIERQLKHILNKRITGSKAVVLIGPRQVGKTTLINKALENKEYLFFTGDDPQVIDLLSKANTEQLKSIIGDHKYMFIDEAQRIPNIGITIKLILDVIKGVKIFISGSSVLDLNRQIKEPLTGRKWEYKLYPISWKEWEDHIGYLKADQALETRLIYGFYPEVINNPEDQIEILQELSQSYLYKDILAISGIRKPHVISKLVQALAFQVGSEVSYVELSQLLSIDAKTVESYIELLEKAFIVFRLRPLSRNLRNELKSKCKVYFYDNGIRNIVINQMSPIALRNDIGMLWENFLISERIKYMANNQLYANCYFWRTKQQQEIDFIEERDGNMTAFEFKWNPKRKFKFSKTFTNNYESKTIGINRDNFRTFVEAGKNHK